MSENIKNSITESLQNHRREATALIAGLAMLGAAGGELANPLEAEARAAPAPAHEIATNGPIPKDVTRDMDRSAAYVKTLGCSSNIIFGALEKPAVMPVALHCSLGTDGVYGTERIKSPVNGKLYIVKRPITAQVGPDVTHTRTVARIDRIIVPSKKSAEALESGDMALGVPEGESITEAVTAYDHQSLTPRQVRELKPGTPLFAAAFPVYAPGNHNMTNGTKQQRFKMHVLGVGKGVTNASTNEMLFASVTNTTEGAACTEGASGALAQTEDLKGVGVLSTTTTDPVKLENGTVIDPATAVNPDGQKIDRICGFSFERPDFKKGAKVVRVVSSKEQIPGYISPEKAVKDARAAIAQGKPKMIIDGLVGVPYDAKHPAKTQGWIDNAMVFANMERGIIIAWADASQPNHLATRYVSNDELSLLQVHPRPGQTSAKLCLSNGHNRFEPGATSDFVDGQHRKIGALHTDVIPNYGKTYGLSPKNGKPVLQSLIIDYNK